MTTTLPIANGKFTLVTYTTEKGECAKLVSASGKVKWNYRFSNSQSRDAYAIKMCERIEENEAHKLEAIEQNKIKQLEAIKAISTDTIFYTSWGYDQTNVDFYKVVKISGKRITVQRLKSDVQETGFMSGETVPADSFYNDKQIIVGLTKYGGFQVDGHYATIWDGKPKYSSWYA